MGASNYTYCDATWSQTLADWIGSHVRMLDYFGAIPEILVPEREACPWGTTSRAALPVTASYEPELKICCSWFADTISFRK